MELNSIDKYTGLTLLCVSLKNNIKELLEEMKKLKLNNYEDLFVNRWQVFWYTWQYTL